MPAGRADFSAISKYCGSSARKAAHGFSSFFVRPELVADGIRLAAVLAVQGSIGRQSRLPCLDPCRCEPLRNVGARAKVHLVGSLALKCRVRKALVVLLDMESDQFSDGRDMVQRIEVQPLMTSCS